MLQHAQYIDVVATTPVLFYAPSVGFGTSDFSKRDEFSNTGGCATAGGKADGLTCSVL